VGYLLFPTVPFFVFQKYKQDSTYFHIEIEIRTIAKEIMESTTMPNNAELEKLMRKPLVRVSEFLKIISYEKN